MNLITKINFNGEKIIIIINNEYIFKEWKNFFKKGYKMKKKLKSL